MSATKTIAEQQPAASPAAAPSGIERRVAPRYPLQQRCLVSMAGFDGPGSWHCIAHNISLTGIGVLLPLSVRPGTILRIEPWGLRDAPALEARVVYAKPFEFVWMCGCELTDPLTDGQLQAWLSRSTIVPPAAVEPVEAEESDSTQSGDTPAN